jgi:hypothetical protein
VRVLMAERYKSCNLAVVGPLSSASKDVSRETDPSIRDSGRNPSGPDLAGGAPETLFQGFDSSRLDTADVTQEPAKRVTSALASTLSCVLWLAARK